MEKKTNTINEPPERNVQGFTPWASGNTNGKKYSDAYVWSVLNLIQRGIKNVAFYDASSDRRVDNKSAKMIVDFLNLNATAMVWCKWKYGYIVIDRTAKGWKLADYSTIKTDSNGAVVGHDDVWYSDTYRHEGKTDFSIIRTNVTNLDTLKNGEDYLVRTFGAFGILSGKDSLPITAVDKDNFLKRIKRTVGITEDKMQFEVFQNPVTFQQVDFKVKDLELTERVHEEVKVIAGYFGVPYDLIPISGASTYNNQQEAVRAFYANCISPIAEMLLEVGRYMIRKSSNVLISSDSLTFRIDNVPELADDRVADIEYKTKVAEFVKACNDAGLKINFSDYIKQLELIEK